MTTLDELLEHILLTPEPPAKKLANLRILKVTIDAIGLEGLLGSIETK